MMLDADPESGERRAFVQGAVARMIWRHSVIRYIPPFIVSQAELGKLSGNFEAYVLLLDIVEFTHIAETYQRQFDHGPDKIGELLNTAMEGPISAISRHDAFVSLFIGDAICAIFPHQNPKHLLAALAEIRDFLDRLVKNHSELSVSVFKMREIISFGEVKWQVFPNQYQYEYLFSGEAFVNLAYLTQEKCNNAYSQSFVSKVGAQYFAQEDGCLRLMIPEVKVTKEQYRDCYLRETLKLFEHKRIMQMNPSNEIRNLAVCFVGYKASRNQLASIQNLHKHAQRFQGYVNKLDFSIGYPVAVVLFGVPHSIGKSVQQAADFALALNAGEPGLAIGLSCGYAYAGYVGNARVREYTALGHCINIASRLMDQAGLGDVICDSSINRALDNGYQMQALGSVNLKGISTDLSYYRLQLKQKHRKLDYKHEFVGRYEELKYLDYVVSTNMILKWNTLIYVNGESGIGKSRLVWHYMQGLSGFHQFFVVCPLYDGKAADPIRQIVSKYFGIDDSKELALKRQKLDQTFIESGWAEQASNKLKLRLASIMDIEYPGSPIAILDELERKKQEIQAFAEFISLLLQELPVLVVIDDGQWLDKDSLDFFTGLNPREANPFFIISTCRYQPDGSKVNLGLEQFKRYELNLGALAEDDKNELLKQIMQNDQIQDVTLSMIREKSAGYPLYLEQMAYYILEVSNKDKSNVSNQQIFTAYSISDVINSRIDYFGHSMRECIYLAAILGMEFDATLFAAVLDQDPDEYLQSGVRHRLWYKKNRQYYRFSHVMIRDVINERMLKSKAKTLHKQIAKALSNQVAFDDHTKDELIAYHYEKAGMIYQTQRHLQMAGRYHHDRNNWHTGTRLHRRACIFSGRHFGFGSIEHVENLFWIALSYHYIQLHDKAVYLYEMVVKHKIRHLGLCHTKMSPYLNNLGRCYKDMGQFEEAEKLLRQSLRQEHEICPGSTNVADRINNLASLYKMQSKWKKALAYSKKSLQLFAASNHSRKKFFEGLLQMNIGYLLLNMGDYDEAEAMAKKALVNIRYIQGAKSPRTAGVYLLLGQCYCMKKDYLQAEKKILFARKKYGQFFGKDSPDYARLNLNLGDLYELMGNPARAARYWGKGAHTLMELLPGNHPLVQQSKLRLEKIGR